MVRWKTVACAALLGVTACGNGDDDTDSAPRKPDTGYGKSEPVPTARTCADFCARAGDCAEHLCNEDSQSTRYDGLGDFLATSCVSACTDSIVNSKITADEWQCFFQDSCREVFDYDTCHAQSSYTCN